jgi:hypothetical protein
LDLDENLIIAFNLGTFIKTLIAQVAIERGMASLREFAL